MLMQSLINFLTSSNLVSRSTAGQIANQFTEQKSSKHDFLLQEGKLANKYFFLENGFMRSFAYDLKGYDITTNF